MNETSSERVASSIDHRLPKWANNQDSWVRLIVQDVLNNQLRCAPQDIDRYLQHLLAEKKLSDTRFEPVAAINEIRPEGTNLEPMRIDSLKLGDGVNAIKSGLEIEFASGVTVVFGENGSGKSGVVRVLKRAAGVRTAEDILHNVHGTSRPKPSALFNLTVGSAAMPLQWENEFGLAPLNRISIFDARAARLHVEDDLSYVYTPGELNIFPIVQNALEQVRSNFEEVIASRIASGNSLLLQFERGCTIYASIETLGAATDIEEIRRYAVLPDEIDATIDSLSTEIDALKSNSIQNELKSAGVRLELVQSIATAISIGQSFSIQTYRSLIEAHVNALRRHDEAGTRAFDGLGIPGALSNEWRAFIEAGERYLQAHLGESYPHPESACAFCQQLLCPAAAELIRKYREFTKNEIKITLDRAERNLHDYSEAVVALKCDSLAERLTAEIAAANDPLNNFAMPLSNLSALAVAAAKGSEIEWPDQHKDLDAAARILALEAERLTVLVSALQTSSDERAKALSEKRSELTELQGKKTAKRLLDQIEKRVADAKWVERATLLKNGITGLMRSLTEAAKEASHELLNKGFEKRFEEECRRLRAPSVRLNFPGRQGQVVRKKTVSEYKPSQVLSEGEQKALALADFLAEVTAVPAASPVVFDDPITSMDYRRIHEVCDRIVALADQHQIVVFTHNIWFAAELLAKADKKRWKYYDIRREGDDSGLVSPASHPRVDTFSQVSGRVKKMIDGAEKADGVIRAALVEKGYEELRGLCEIVVEQEMLKDVVRRYEPNIRMTNLDKINAERLREGFSIVVPIFEKACRYIASHSQPVETQGIRPGVAELKSDFEAVMAARDVHKIS